MSSSPRESSDVDWKRFHQLVDSKQKIALTTHVRPDCDAVGSELAMAAILSELGKEVRCINAFELPPNLRFLDSESKLQQLGEADTREWLESADLLIVLDTSAWAQLGEMGDVIRTTSAAKAVVDHHVSGDDLGAELFKNTSAEATGRLVFEAAGQLGVEITPRHGRSSLRGAGHRHRLVSLFVHQCRNLSGGGRSDRGGCRTGEGLQGPL